MINNYAHTYAGASQCALQCALHARIVALPRTLPNKAEIFKFHVGICVFFFKWFCTLYLLQNVRRPIPVADDVFTDVWQVLYALVHSEFSLQLQIYQVCVKKCAFNVDWTMRLFKLEPRRRNNMFLITRNIQYYLLYISIFQNQASRQ